MGQIAARGIDTIRDLHPQLHTALSNVIDGVNTVGSVAGIGSGSPLAPPTNTGMLSVKAMNGVFDAAIMDPNPQRGEHYFLEWDTTPSFSNAKTIPLGPGRNWRGSLGNMTTYWRHYKQMLGSDVSPHAYFGSQSAPTPVNGGGAAGPTPHPSQGSGSSTIPGKGFGPIK